MDYKTMLALALPFGLAIAAVASAISLGKAVSSAMEAIGRQPEASGKIMFNMVIGCVFIETITIYVLVFSFIMTAKI